MALTHVLQADLAKVWSAPTGGKVVRMVAWGHPLEVTATTSKHIEVRLWRYVETENGARPSEFSGFIRLRSGVSAERAIRPIGESDVLKFEFVDVQQGDAAVLETPRGRVVLFDGGESNLFARYLAGRYRRTTESRPKPVEAVVVSHGDADHFSGLTAVQATETRETDWRRVYLQPRRVYHNGLIKRPSTKAGKRTPDKELLGPTVDGPGGPVAVGLAENPLDVPAAEMNRPFQAWRRALLAWQDRAPIEFRRLRFGVDDAFDFLADEAIEVEVLGPIETEVDGTAGLGFFREHPPGPVVNVESMTAAPSRRGSISASHTINGHSVVLRIRYGNVRFLLSGDLNEEAGELLLTFLPDRLQAEVLKVPHHGSADFSGPFIGAVSPIVSIVSSGDESRATEYIHPRATLMAGLGRLSRVAEPVIFVTELVAFFAMEGQVLPESHLLGEDGTFVPDPKARKPFFAFSRANFGIVRVRTDGHRLLVYTDSALADLKEAYAYEVDDQHNVTPVRVLQL